MLGASIGNNVIGDYGSRERIAQPLNCSLSRSASQQTRPCSSLLDDSMTHIIVEDLQSEHEPTSALLEYCKRKFLRPYVWVLALVGLNPIATDSTICRASCSYFQALLIGTFLFCGYFLQYLCAYRGDRGFANSHKIQPKAQVPLNDSHDSLEWTLRALAELLFGYIIPSLLHLSAFVSAIVLCKIVDKEQMQNLIERVFLMSLKPQRLCRMLWAYVGGGVALLALLTAYSVTLVLMETPLLKIALLVALFVQDLVQVTIISSYCIECYLLRVHLATLSHKLIMHSIDSLSWMRELLDFHKLLEHLNERVSIPICLVIVMHLTNVCAGFVYLLLEFDFHYASVQLVALNIARLCLCLFMGLMPFFMAATVSSTCRTAQANGHHVRVRSFLYHNATPDDLNSTLLFASSLRMAAKLFHMPIECSYLCFALLIVAVLVLTLGMSVNLSLLDSV